ncbi:PREDICTED: transmembrane 9 superfamily member 5-like [Nelumbo nucifera]|uniref:Transmembrane 9 superfamily member n=1 Tax=Nelumbo nucifera TaxID=4432 RepID=A0A1U8AY65_NELNU|nr:PREDICTED: transmembrane 9 superfamily member 5-like [Nelumbo nucifera]
MVSEARFVVLYLFVIFTALATSFRTAIASPKGHRYNVGDDIPLFVNKVGSMYNPSETYPYYDFPFCRPDPVIEKKRTLMEVLNGDILTNSLYVLKFRENKKFERLCEKKLTKDEVAKFRDAVSNDFYLQMYYDDLPLWLGFGDTEEDEDWFHSEIPPLYYLYSHIKFDVLYNENQVIEVQAFSDLQDGVDITDDIETNVTFTYSVVWSKTEAPFVNRMGKYSVASFLLDIVKLRSFSLIYRIVIIAKLIGMLATLLLQNLRDDIIKSSMVNEEGMKEVGWKYTHGDAFSNPPYTSLLCAVLGTGTQLLTLFFFVFLLVLLGVLYPYSHGTLYSSLVVIYAFTSMVGGYTASSFHVQLAGTSLRRTILLAGVLYFVPLFAIFLVLNKVAISYRITASISFNTIVVLLLIWTLLSILMFTIGGVLGYTFKSHFRASCSTRRGPKETTTLAWYRKTLAQMFLSGVLSFCTVIMELDYIYTSLWCHNIFTESGTFFIMFILLIIYTAILSIGMTYVQLLGEDHEWCWRSVLRGGSVSIFMYGYCIDFYSRSTMSGFMQLLFFFGYNACICYALFLVLGTVGFYASLVFVRHVYHAVKNE